MFGKQVAKTKGPCRRHHARNISALEYPRTGTKLCPVTSTIDPHLSG